MTEGRLIQAALSAAHAGALLARLKPARAMPWLDDLQPVGRVEAKELGTVYALTDVCLLAGCRIDSSDAEWSELVYIAMPARDQDLPWERRRLELVTAEAMCP